MLKDYYYFYHSLTHKKCVQKLLFAFRVLNGNVLKIRVLKH